MNINAATSKVETFLNRFAPQGMKSKVHRWGDSTPLVSEVSFSDNRAGCAYMQSDLPWGLAVCAQVERCVVAVSEGWENEDDGKEEFQRLEWLLTTKDK
jgi:hypothetical protein